MGTITLKFQGQSDDTFGEVNHNLIDHDNCANGSPIVFRVIDHTTDDGLFVVGVYGNDFMPPGMPGTWLVGVQNIDDDRPLPNWPMRLVAGSCDYSPTLEIECPVNVEITLWR